MDASHPKNAGATAPSGAVARPAKRSYTPPDNGKSTPMTDAPGDQASAFDRKLAEGLNVLHLHNRLDRVERETQRLDRSVSRLEHEILEFRRETRAHFTRLEELRTADLARWEETRRTDTAELKGTFRADLARSEEARKADTAELKADVLRLDGARKADTAELKADILRLDEAHKADIAELKEMIRALTEQVQKNAKQTAIALERSAGFAWTRQRLAVGVLLLIAGALFGALGRVALAALGVG